jgi:hypothetical protein
MALIYRDVQRTMGFSRPAEEIERYSARVESYLQAWPTLAFPWAAADPVADAAADASLYTGVAVVLLAAAALALPACGAADIPSGGAPRAAWLRWRPAIVAAGALLVISFTASGWTGVASSAAMWLLLGAATIPPPRGGAPLYGLIALWSVVLSLGPVPRAWERTIVEPSPYRGLMLLPGIASLRAPGRFGLLTVLALAVLTAMTLARTLPGRRLAVRGAACGLVSLLILAEGFAAPIEIHSFGRNGRVIDREAYEWLRGQPPGGVLELPIRTSVFRQRRGGGGDTTLAYQFGTLSHGHPILNGISGFAPPLVEWLSGDGSPMFYMREVPEVVRMVRALGVRYLVVHQTDYASQGLVREILAAIRGTRGAIEEERAFGDTIGFRLAPLSLQVPSRAGMTAVPLSGLRFRTIDANAPADPAQPSPGAWLAIDLDRPRDIGMLRLIGGTDGRTGYPHELVVAVADVSGHTTTIHEGSSVVPLGMGLAREPTTAPIELAMPEGRVKTIWLKQAPDRRDWPWSIARLTMWERQHPPPPDAVGR